MEHAILILRKQIDALLHRQQRVIIAIDGSCTSGKTTLAEALSKIYDCNVFHMDDFFLQPHQRTPERLAEAGGNVDYERFYEEVLSKLQAGTPFSYRPYSCRTGQLAEAVEVLPKQLNLVEGTYSQHPFFGNVYDLKVFLTVTPQQQAERIRRRPSFLHKRFFEEWIPMEQQYFQKYPLSGENALLLDLSE